MPACSSDWGGSVTLNTCGGMVLGTQRSEELSNNGEGASAASVSDPALTHRPTERRLLKG